MGETIQTSVLTSCHRNKLIVINFSMKLPQKDNNLRKNRYMLNNCLCIIGLHMLI